MCKSFSVPEYQAVKPMINNLELKKYSAAGLQILLGGPSDITRHDHIELGSVTTSFGDVNCPCQQPGKCDTVLPKDWGDSDVVVVP
ncbi:hypothetical protein HAX54_022081 [Datura stramonium]|uniref:Uncharacterized protein n=1 Tax=Datura stramonium TaxID=4076 RepID=A0ABS8UV66_DATST|nr:hypothetical protein [Datura stramonium]